MRNRMCREGSRATARVRGSVRRVGRRPSVIGRGGARSLRGAACAAAAALVVGCAGLIGLGDAIAADLPDPRTMEVPPLGEIQVPTPERFGLDNGMTIYLLENHDFPIVEASALVRIGSIYEPAGKAGLAEITGDVMRTGGTTSIPGDDLDRKLESMGASAEISIGSVEGDANLSALTENAREGIRILADLLRNPALPQEKVDLAKVGMRTQIASRNDESFDIFGRELTKLIYGTDHPYARHTEYSTVEAIGREDLVAFHKEYFHPDRTILTVYGDFKSADMKKWLREAFGDWPKSKAPLPADPEVHPGSTAGVYLAHKGDATNSIVAIGQIGMRRDDPDYPAMAVLSEILGGGFSSRLFNEIRTKRGLAYAAGSFVGAGYHHPAPMLFFAVTQTDSTAATAGYVMDEVERALAEEVTAQELQRAKDSILNALVFDVSSERAVLNRIAQYEFYGYPADFLQTYQERVRQVTAADLLEAGRRKIRPAELATFIIGNREQVGPQLAALGEVAEIDISIPDPPAAAIPEGTEADYRKGQELLGRAAAAMGGDALDAVKSLTLVEEGKISFQGMEFPATVRTVKKYPDCVFAEQTLPMGVMKQALCEDAGWMQAPNGITPLGDEQRAQFDADMARDLVTLLGAPESVRAQALAEEATVDGRPADVVLLRDPRVKEWKLFLDRESGLVVRMEYRDKSPFTGSPVVVQEDFGGYAPAGPIQWPHSRSQKIDGEPFAQFAAKSVVVNGEVAADLFAQPAQ